MTGITLDQAEARLAVWLAADEAVAKGQSYSVAGRSVTRAESSEIRENINFWERKVNSLANGSRGARVRYGVYDR